MNDFLRNRATIRGISGNSQRFIPFKLDDNYHLIQFQNRLWRKTRTPYGSCRGADPNRNWGYQWNTDGGSNDPCSDIYPGPSAFSEASTKSLSHFISGIAPKLTAYIAFHSYSQLLLLPYGTTEKHLDNYDKMVSAQFQEKQNCS